MIWTILLIGFLVLFTIYLLYIVYLTGKKLKHRIVFILSIISLSLWIIGIITSISIWLMMIISFFISTFCLLLTIYINSRKKQSKTKHIDITV